MRTATCGLSIPRAIAAALVALVAVIATALASG
jgi:hypothetical protein